ncbi:MAG: DUF4124 domain-containing protein, partial [Woeseia sp.]|nr:DUF4124 domain-containing protein [Woeseia sp.]
ASAQVYKWTDADGVVHYSDQPTPGAEIIDIQENTIRTRRARVAPRSAPSDETPDTAAAFSYESISFSAPVSEQTLWNIGGNLSVAVSLTPGLRPTHQVRLYFDGEMRPINGLGTQLEEVWRGAHNLQAEVVDENGALLIRSEPIRFFVQQTSIQN